MMPPVEVPPMTSKSSCTRRPDAASRPLSISIVSRPRVPPPSSASTRTPPGGAGRGCHPCRSRSRRRASSQQRDCGAPASCRYSAVPHSGHQKAKRRLAVLAAMANRGVNKVVHSAVHVVVGPVDAQAGAGRL
jgi:hypothetical protein